MTAASPQTTVLLVDDDNGVRLVTRRLLERAGYAVLDARNGREAVAMVRNDEDDIDVVLLDVMMPEMTGTEAFPHLRRLRPELPVIFFSGYSQNEVTEHLIRPTAYTSFLPKPSDIDVMTAEIDRAVAG